MSVEQVKCEKCLTDDGIISAATKDWKSTAIEANGALSEYVREKNLLQNVLDEKDKEMSKFRARLYDATKKIEMLEEQVHSLEKERDGLKESYKPKAPVETNGGTPHAQAAARGKRQPPNSSRRPSTTSRRFSMKPTTPAKPVKRTESKKSSPEKTPTPQSSPIVIRDQPAISELQNRMIFLQLVAKKFPELHMSVFFQAEKFFEECDTNSDGEIDEKELEKILCKQGHLCTDKELNEIMIGVDKDGTGTIDMMEYLAVMERMQTRKRVPLPPAVVKSGVCVVQ